MEDKDPKDPKEPENTVPYAKYKAETDRLKLKNDELSDQLEGQSKTLEELKAKLDGGEDISKQLEEAKERNAKLAEEMKASEVRYAATLALKDAGCLDPQLVLASWDMGKKLDIEGLKEEKPYLFEKKSVSNSGEPKGKASDEPASSIREGLMKKFKE